MQKIKNLIFVQICSNSQTSHTLHTHFHIRGCWQNQPKHKQSIFDVLNWVIKCFAVSMRLYYGAKKISTVMIDRYHTHTLTAFIPIFPNKHASARRQQHVVVSNIALLLMATTLYRHPHILCTFKSNLTCWLLAIKINWA